VGVPGVASMMGNAFLVFLLYLHPGSPLSHDSYENDQIPFGIFKCHRNWIFCDRSQIFFLSRFCVQDLCNLDHLTFSYPNPIADPYKPSLLFIYIFEFCPRFNMAHASCLICNPLSCSYVAGGFLDLITN